MELRHLRTFRTVARTLNFTRAAAELNYAQSSVTEQIQALETELAAKLFDRSHRKLSLTPAGERLVEYADQMLLLAQEARTAVEDEGQEPGGQLTVGGLETLCAHRLPPILARYRRLYPRVQVTLREGGRGQLYEWVRRGEIDVALTFGQAPQDKLLASESLATDRLMVVTPTGHRLASYAQVGGPDLRGESFLATPQGCGFREMLDTLIHTLGPDAPVIDTQVASMAALCQCASAGMGCALLPEIAVVGAAARGEVAAVPLKGSASHTQVTMTWLRRAELRASVPAFLGTAREAFQELERAA
ncbi:LysR family transcriptional regulator [Streptomyces spinoverrucosus]|uniref:LysR family transcriptional regulator n=1 Tax=Streptomyces spinoverrucosus TaxID=284043 RepID=UPI001A321F25|nr:LysR family transcriptional regulator [Streptomyces spinoverrucosus]MBG0853548.1 LysR family transcriptional regulator [Streptomyces spinoverrucosus]